MDGQALRREAVAWFKRRLAADEWLEEIRAQTRPMRPVAAPVPPLPPRRARRAGARTRAA